MPYFGVFLKLHPLLCPGRSWRLSGKIRGPWGLCSPWFCLIGLDWGQSWGTLSPESSRLLSASFPSFIPLRLFSTLLSSPLQALLFLPTFFSLPIFVSPSQSLLKKKKNQQNQSTERLDLQMSGQETGNKGNQSRRRSRYNYCN